MGRLRERLRALGLGGKTLLVFTGDHGEEFLEHGRTFHGQSAYGELTGVPLVFWGPGWVPGGRVVEESVETIDIMPTLLELSRLPIPPQAQGASLLPFLAPQPAGRGPHPVWPDRPAISEKAATVDASTPAPHDLESFAIVSGGWKL